MAHSSWSTPLATALQSAQQAFTRLSQYHGSDRNRGVRAMAKGLVDHFDQILEANTLDLEMSREMAISPCLLDWLKLTPERLASTVELLQQLAELPDPIQRVMNAPYQLNPSQTYCQLMPLGVVALIYEAFPELGAITAGFCLKTGNSLILRGCGTASHSNTIITQVLRQSLETAGLPAGCIESISSDDLPVIQDLIVQDKHINLIIPYGRASLVEQVAQQSVVPVLKAALGNCYLYWSLKSDLELVRWMILDSHASEPDPVNAIEKVLLSPSQNGALLARLFNSLQEKGFELRGDAALCQEFPSYLTLAKEVEWSRAYLAKIIAFRTMPSLTEAITWINQHSSGHADCIATESYPESRQFAMEIDSALVYINASPRFSRNPKQGESLFLGISNQKGHRRGLIGLETFTTLKQVVQGNGRS